MIDLLADLHINVYFALGTAYFLLLSLSNVLWLRMSSRRPRKTTGPLVSVLIPARDEEDNIGRCLDSLVNQTYENYEIIVLDDQSTDRTWNIISEFAHNYPELVKVHKGKKLPESGWTGKAHAMQQLSRLAAGEYFLFTDADTAHQPESVAWAVTNIEAHHVDLVSGYLNHELETFGEKLIVPAMYIMTAFLMPLWLIPSTKTPAFSFAIGQLIMFKRSAFEAIGGYSAVSERISDDIFIVRELKKAGYRAIFLDISDYVSCRMYTGYTESMNGISKNIFDFFKHRPLFFAIALTLLAIFTLLPLYLLIIRLLAIDARTPATELSVLLFALAWSLTLYDRGSRWWVPLLYPVLFLHLLYMTWRCFGKVAVGHGIVWKGRGIR
ncbi:MAG: glycosyltransferase [Spirochaetales bacterium]|nr:glycosyltransferase [Spirochaetales bacterium]